MGRCSDCGVDVAVVKQPHRRTLLLLERATDVYKIIKARGEVPFGIKAAEMWQKHECKKELGHGDTADDEGAG